MPDLRLHVIPLTDAEIDTNGNPTRPFAITPQEFVLVEVPVMLSVCSVCNRTKGWFPQAERMLQEARN